MTVRIVTFRTPDPFYEYLGFQWRASLDRLGIEYELFVVPPFPKESWALANHSRPRFIRERLDEHRGPVFWMDIDTIAWQDFRYYLDHLEKVGTDFACHWLGGYEAFGSNLYFGDTEKARRLIDLWEEFLPKKESITCHVDHKWGNQKPLGMAIRQMRIESGQPPTGGPVVDMDRSRWQERPLLESMAFLTDLREHGKRSATPYIECFQASRCLKDEWWTRTAHERSVQSLIYRELNRRVCTTIPGVKKPRAKWRKRLAKWISG